MSLFKNLFQSNSSENEDSKLNWIPLTEMKQLIEIISISTTKPVLIFKHSTRCGISRMVLKNFEREYDIPASKMDLYYLDLLENRAISTEITSKFNVMHQSPQALVIDKGHVVYHDSHSGISVEAIKKAI